MTNVIQNFSERKSAKFLKVRVWVYFFKKLKKFKRNGNRFLYTKAIKSLL